MRRELICLLLVVVMVATLFPTASATNTPNTIDSTEQIGGRTWTTDIRVTRNTNQDHAAQVTVDSNHDAHIMWQSARTPSGYYYVKLDRAGNYLSPETFITDKVLTSWGAQYPYGPNIDIDSQQNLHVTFDYDYMNVGYAKYDDQGNVVVAPKKVAAVDGSSSHTPTLAVGLDDTVHIANEDYKFQCEDIVYHKLNNDGSEAFTMHVVSSDVATHCEFDLIKASRYSGNFLFTFGSSSGTWLGRMDRYGTKNMPSVKIRPEMDYKIADAVETPNGDMHLVWFDPTVGGKIHYSRVNASGILVNDDVIIAPNAVDAGMPRITATSKGEVVVVWEDKRNGNFDIYYAVISPNHEGEVPENVRLTSDPADQIEPWVITDPDDNFHVVWTDKREGNEEIYYKFMFNFALELSADPLDLANLYFIHPGETKSLTMSVKNKGGLVDSYLVDLLYTSGATQAGWEISVDQTSIEDVGADEVRPLKLTIKAPGDAHQGDNVSITINVSSVTAPGTWDSVDIPVFVRVTRELLLTTDPTMKIGNNGDTVRFTLVALNKGDVREDNIEVLVGSQSAPNGWTVTADKDFFALDSKETTFFNVSVTVPTDTTLAPANFPAQIGVTIRSTADTSVMATKQLTVVVLASFFIRMTSDLDHQYGNPGDLVKYHITIQNIGNLAGQAKIDVNSQNPSASGWRASLDKQTVFLAGSQSATVELSVLIPDTALAATRLTLVVSAVALSFGVTGQVGVDTYVNTIYDLSFDVGSSPDVKVGRLATFPITVTNAGNGDETLTLAPDARLPVGWNMTFALSSAELTTLYVPHGESRTFDARIVSDLHAGAGLHPMGIVVIDSGANHYLINLPVKIVQFFGVDMAAAEYKLASSPGRTMEYDLMLANGGNGFDNFTLSVEDLPVDVWHVEFYRVVGTDGSTVPIDVLNLAPQEQANIKLRMTVPIDTTARSAQFTARATSAAGEEDSIILAADIKLADLKVGRVDFSPSNPLADQIDAITVAVSNSGEIEASPVVVVFYDNGQEIGREQVSRIAASQRGFVTFAWLPKGGSHNLEFLIDPPCDNAQAGATERGCVIEIDEDDNVYTQTVNVGTSGSFLPGPDAAMSIMAIAAVVGLGLVGGRRRLK